MTGPRRKPTPRHVEPDQASVPPGAPAWVTPELIEHTVHVWQPFYKRELTPEDALELLLSADRLLEFLSPKDNLQQQPFRRSRRQSES